MNKCDIRILKIHDYSEAMGCKDGERAGRDIGEGGGGKNIGQEGEGREGESYMVVNHL